MNRGFTDNPPIVGSFERIASVEFTELDAGPVPRVVSVKDVPYTFNLREGQSFGPYADMFAANAARRVMLDQMPELLGVKFLASTICHKAA